MYVDKNLRELGGKMSIKVPPEMLSIEQKRLFLITESRGNELGVIHRSDILDMSKYLQCQVETKTGPRDIWVPEALVGVVPLQQNP